VALPVFTAGDILTAANLRTLQPLFARKTADETINNVAVNQNDDHLFMSVIANAVYEFHGEMRYTTNSTANIKIAWSFPTGTTMRYSAHVVPVGLTTWATFPLIQSDALAGDDSASLITFTGLIIVSTTPGIVQLQWSQNTANVSNTTVSAGSYLRLQRME
jgi:hypothetical protein